MMGRFARTRRGDIKARLSAVERGFLRQVCEDLRTTLRDGDRNDPVLQRLYPAASLDDLDLAAQVDDMIRDDLTRQRFEAIDRCEATVGDERVSTEDLEAWLSVCNDARLMIGVRIGVGEDSVQGDFSGEAGVDMESYRMLTGFVSQMIAALSGITERSLAPGIAKRMFREGST